MNSRTYKIIFGLLGFSILSILIVQGVWIRNFYYQKKDQFNVSVYNALQDFSDKLYDNNQLRGLQEKTFIVKDIDNVDSFGNKKVSIKIKSGGKTKNLTAFDFKELDSLEKLRSLDQSDIKIMMNGQKQQANVQIVEFTKSVQGGTEHVKEIEEILQRISGELKQLNFGSNSDSISDVLRNVLDDHGIFLPFEFSLQLIRGKINKTLSRSAGFNEALPHFSNDLSANRFLHTDQYLWLQFPGDKYFILSGMKNSLILSLIFSLILLTVFTYTIQLIRKQKKLAEIKTDFVNNMTHELKTPIATISLALDAMNNPQIKNDAEKTSEYFKILKEENQKLNSHVERVLQMSLLDKGELHLNKKSVDLNVIVEESIRTFALQIKEQQAEVLLDREAEPLIVHADHDHLLSAFNNILDNALKYSSEKCKIQIESSRKDNTVTITIRDNGIGIAKEHQERIFEKFFRAQGGNLHDVKGFGLGLSYVKSIIEAHGGTIELENDYKHGTSFKIKLRLENI